MNACSIPDEDLLAFADGYLEGGRRELVEAHLRACPLCQQRLDAFREVDAILRATSPKVDSQAHQRELMRKLEREGPSTPFRWSVKPLLVVATIAVLIIAIWPGTSGASFPFDRAIRIGAVQVRRVIGTHDTQSSPDRPSAAPVGTIAVGQVGERPGPMTILNGVATAPGIPKPIAFDAVEPQQLPLGLSAVERGQPTPARFELLYRNAEGTAILLAQSPAEPNTVVVDPFAGATIHQIAGTAVLVLPDPRPDAVAAMMWERDGVVFALYVTDAPYDGLKLADAMSIVEAVSAAQSQ